MKHCSKCNIDKNESEFYHLHTKCKSCERAISKEYRNTHKADVKAYQFVHDKTPKGRYSIYKRSAKRCKREFQLSFEQFDKIISQPCFYCGAKPYSGIDRIDSDKGYINDNCVPCCSMCNVAKNDYAQPEYIAKCKAVYHHSVTPSWAEISLMAHNILERQPRNEIHIYKS